MMLFVKRNLEKKIKKIFTVQPKILHRLAPHSVSIWMTSHIYIFILTNILLRQFAAEGTLWLLKNAGTNCEIERLRDYMVNVFK